MAGRDTETKQTKKKPADQVSELRDLVVGYAKQETLDPLTIPAHQYDIVCNGYEIASGAIATRLAAEP